MNQSKLSRQQKKILAWICGLKEAGIAMPAENPRWGGCVWLREVRCCYMPDFDDRHYPVTNSQSASFSRAVRRLEKRGLVELFNSIRPEEGNFQKNLVRLTKEGMKVAKPLVGEHIRERLR